MTVIADDPSAWTAAPEADRPRWPLAGRVAAQLAALVVAWFAYRAVRVLTEGNEVRALRHAAWVLAVERALGIDWELGAQGLVLDHPVAVQLANVLYTWVYWPTVIGALVALFFLDRGRCRRYRNALLVSGGLGLVTFAAFPLAPPRFLPGYVDTITEFSGQSALAHPPSFANPYAAMPSFHVGWTVLAGVALLGAVRHPLARLAVLLPGAAMSVVVVVTANHYVVDGLVGIGVAAIGWVLAEPLGAVIASRRRPGRTAVATTRRRCPRSCAVRHAGAMKSLTFTRDVRTLPGTTPARGTPEAVDVVCGSR